MCRSLVPTRQAQVILLSDVAYVRQKHGPNSETSPRSAASVVMPVHLVTVRLQNYSLILPVMCMRRQVTIAQYSKLNHAYARLHKRSQDSTHTSCELEHPIIPPYPTK
ncbi:hypothetical protein GDO78_009739 [Eleutherodactylus coqui]|uniref:Uncharacterized protein n=1 Tax=Eleutherodactylus coqui TaxID=57060 RepID=A0A8J6FC94_ELECQ|nr:hypothetical protein GDO78_009739 [Eleutherodactylus coqui]